MSRTTLKALEMQIADLTAMVTALTIGKETTVKDKATDDKVATWNANAKRTEAMAKKVTKMGYDVVKGAKTTWYVLNGDGVKVAVLKPFSARLEMVQYVDGRKCYVAAPMSALKK